MDGVKLKRRCPTVAKTLALPNSFALQLSSLPPPMHIAMHCTSRSLLAGAFRLAVQPHPSTLPPPFLLPAFTTIQRATFSSSPSPQARKDGNPNRGISPLRRKVTTRFAKRVEKDIANIPQPVLDPRLRSAVEVDEDHGLWEFFGQDKNSLATPVEISAHGRGWTVAELRRKDWDDLWRLWWVCLKDRNRLATFEAEKERIGNLYGEEESKKRRKEVRMRDCI